MDAPPFSQLAAEPWRALAEWLQPHRERAVHDGDGAPVLVIPGLGGGAFSTRRLRDALSAAGYAVRDWGLGINTGAGDDLAGLLDTLDATLADMQAADGRPVSLVGWSLGGLFARELAKRSEDRVRQVITLGTPLRALESGTHAGALYRLLNGGGGRLTPALARRLATHPKVPLTAIISREDGIVAWQASAVRAGPRRECIEVPGASHLGMCANPAVIDLVADRLAHPPGTLRAAAIALEAIRA